MSAQTYRIIGHRGAAAHAPENTIAGLEEGRRRGADWLECDVRCTADGVPVLLHDATLDRTTDGSGPVASRQASELRALDAGSWFGRGDLSRQRVPTLAEAVEWAAQADVQLCLDVKADLGERAFDAIGRVCGTPAAARAVGLVLSGEPGALRALLERLPAARGGLLYRASDSPASAVAAAREAGAWLLHPSRAVVGEAMVGAAHEAGLLAGVYLPPDTPPERLRELAAWGVDVFNVDSPDTVRRVLQTP